MRSKTAGAVLTVAGIVLLVTAAVIFSIRLYARSKNSIDPSAAAERIEKLLPERSAGIAEERENAAMAAIEIDGIDFVGLLELPDRNIKLPVAASWGNADFSFRPARYTGSVYSGTLIIGGEYSENNFDFVDSLDPGEEIIFTDMLGCVFHYTVEKISHSDNADTETLQSGSSTLTLFVKKDSAYLIVRCSNA